MTTNFRVSSKMHLFIIISCLIIALGMALGLTFKFAFSGSYFNRGADWEDYKTVTVSYEAIDFSGNSEEPLDKVKSICEKAFSDSGVKSYKTVYGNNGASGEIVYSFVNSTDSAKLDEAAQAIETEIKKVGDTDDVKLSKAYARTALTVRGGDPAIIRCVIAIAVTVGIEFIYFIIRYRFTMALAALLAQVHNLALFLALVALTRLPVGSSLLAFALMTTLLTAIGSCFYFDRVRKNIKLKKAGNFVGKDSKNAYDLTDVSACESFKFNLIMAGVLAVVAVLAFVLLSISAMSVLTALNTAGCALICFIATAYGTILFVPSVYSRFKLLGDKLTADKPSKTKNKSGK